MNSLHIPALARNKAEALRFLAYVMRADVQEKLDRAMLLLPVNIARRNRPTIVSCRQVTNCCGRPTA